MVELVHWGIFRDDIEGERTIYPLCSGTFLQASYPPSEMNFVTCMECMENRVYWDEHPPRGRELQALQGITQYWTNRDP